MNTEVKQSQEEEEIEMFGDKEIRWYQSAARNGVEQALEAGATRILVVAPTGSGKTITSGLIFTSPHIRKLLGIKGTRPLRLLFLAHKNRLLTQAERTYADAANVELIPQSAFKPIPDELVKEGWDVTCIDEAHHEAMATIQYRLEQLVEHPIIGLTATPDRADGCLIKFEEIVEPITREQAVHEGYLAKTELLSFIDTPMKDKTMIMTDIIHHFGHLMGQTMIFMRTKQEVRNVHAVLIEHGYNSVAILGQSARQLDTLLDEFSDGKVQFLVNCDKINEGVDVASCTDVFLGRQFGSYPQLNQVIGRASRPDSECRVWELINPLSGRNLDTTVIVGLPESHLLYSKRQGAWTTREFNVVRTGQRSINSGLNPNWATQ